MTTLPLHDRTGAVIAHTTIDDRELPFVGPFRWCLNANGYAWRSIDSGKRHIYLHRAVMGCTPGDGMYVDHINRDRLDNRRANLRVVTPAEAAQNKPALRGRYRGVSWDKARGKWSAHAQLDRKHYHLGRFDDEDDAGRAVADWRRDHMPFSEEAAS